MPIYEYRCGTCGFQKEYLQKLNDAPLKTCPECGNESFSKMLTAAGFQLKGGGWYATDFKGCPAKPESKQDSGPPAQGCGGCACAGNG
ncbi:MAG: zinc ribbon domain-containing protein [Zoogloeaceae bacterium]|jgi:putative FmdB family regulatory protein|nr:zinc ribbon domain-containing protein [Zoogloeaceae bacterium]